MGLLVVGIKCTRFAYLIPAIYHLRVGQGSYQRAASEMIIHLNEVDIF